MRHEVTDRILRKLFLATVIFGVLNLACNLYMMYQSEQYNDYYSGYLEGNAR